jgi:hypothetical protein
MRIIKGIFAAVVMIVVTSLVLNAQKPDSWVTFDSEAGHFSILMPEIPKDETETKPTPYGPYTSHTFITKTMKGLFLVGWVDYDPRFKFTIQDELNANRDNFVKAVHATLLRTTPITLNGNPGIEFTAESPEANIKSRVYIVGRRPYQVAAATYKSEEDADTVQRFFDSFTIKKP